MLCFSPVLLSLLFSRALLAVSYAVEGRSEGGDKISGLLERPSGKRPLAARQSETCNVGYHECTGFDGCCRDGTTCGVFGGKPGCCPAGRSCVANTNPCVFQGDDPCPGENFCCPSGDTCSRDSAGLARCSSLGSSSIAELSTTFSGGRATSSRLGSTRTRSPAITQTGGVGPTGVGTAPAVTVDASNTADASLPSVSIKNPLLGSASSLTPGGSVLIVVTSFIASLLF